MAETERQPSTADFLREMGKEPSARDILRELDQGVRRPGPPNFDDLSVTERAVQIPYTGEDDGKDRA
jgi:hypothetical protein